MSHPNREVLAAYWLGDLPEADALALEEHLFACEPCTAESARMAALPRALSLAVPPALTKAESLRLRALDARIAETHIASGGRGVADFSGGAPAQLIVLEADLTGAEQVEMTMRTRDGALLVPSLPVSFDAEAGTVIIACRDYYVTNAQFPLEITIHVEAISAGKRRPAGVFELDHIPPV